MVFYKKNVPFKWDDLTQDVYSVSQKMYLMSENTLYLWALQARSTVLQFDKVCVTGWLGPWSKNPT